MKRVSYLIAILAVLFSGMAVANDSEYYAVGNQLVPLRQTSIRVSKEVLSIDLRDDNSAYVDVYYEFTNPESAPKTITMGFEADPPYFCYDEDLNRRNEHPYIKNFTVEINGQRIAHKNAISHAGNFRPIRKTMQLCAFDEDSDPTNDDLVYVYYFEATFQPGVNKVHHTYHYQLGSSTTHFYFLEYKLSPAARWANGQIDDFTLRVSAKQTAKHFFIPTNCVQGMQPRVVSGKGKTRRTKSDMDDSQEWEIAVRKGVVEFHAAKFRPKHELYLHSGLLCGGLNATYDRSMYMAECGFIENNDFTTRVIHNLPYASRGRVFKDPKLQAFFESCWWYMPNPNYKDDTSDFTPVDWNYIYYKPGKEE